VRIRLGCVAFAVAMVAGRSAGAQQIAFTFDDLPVHGPLPQGETRLAIADSILSTFKSEKMPTVYGFINGVHLEKEPDTAAVLKAWRDAGEPLGNHTYEHVGLNDVTAAAFEEQIEKNEPILERYMPNEDWYWFRYPFLQEGDTTEKRREVGVWLAAHGYKIAEVNMSFGDYLWNEPYARCVAKHDEASIKVLHDSYLAAAEQFAGVSRTLSKEVYGRDVPYVLLMHIGAFDARMLPELIALYRARGFTFVSLQDAEKDPAYGDDPELGMVRGGAQLGHVAAQRKLPYPKAAPPTKMLDGMCR
jgi:peptidoglycan-N-acetylglucosamine deacetylase